MLTVKQKISKINLAKKKLKQQFIGIDKPIDQICNSLKTFLLFPDALHKPVIINLWGITGTFKTSFIRALIKELDYTDKFVEVDSRELQSGITPLLGHPNADKKDIILPSIFLLDEFQNARTIDRFGNDTERADGLAELFSFLSDGKVTINRGNFKVEQILFLKNRITTDIDAVIQQIEEFYDQRSGGRSSRGDIPTFPDSKKVEPKEVKFTTKMNYFYEYYIDRFTDLTGEDFTKREFKTPKEALQAVYEILSDYGPTKTFDLSKSLIIIAANLDEVFGGLTHVMDGDYISPDEFYAMASRVNFNQVKQALLSRFKPEQVARLGSNHVIFPSFNTKMYQALIESLNKRSISKFKEMGIKIKIDKSVNEFILKHNALPSQGARSVLSAHEYLVDSNLSEIIAETLVAKGKEVLVGIVNNKVHLINDKKKLIKKNIDIIDLNVLRNYEEKDVNHTICVHEASHGVVSTALLGEVPSMIKVRMSDTSIGGYCKIDGFPSLPNRRDYINYIAIALAGYVGELIDKKQDIELVSTGSSSDISNATMMAAALVKEYGLGETGRIVASGFSMVKDMILVEDNKKMEDEIESIVNEGFLLAFVTLQTMEKEHYELTEILKKNVTVKRRDIEHIFRRS